MSNLLIIVDVQRGFMNEYTAHIPGRIRHLIERTQPETILFTRFVNVAEGPYQRFLDWHACEHAPETDIAPELQLFACEELTFAKPGLTGISDEMRDYFNKTQPVKVDLAGVDTDMCVLKVAMDIFDLGIEPIILTDCCASTAGLQAHLAGLAVLARNIGAGRLADAGLSGGKLAAPDFE